MLSYLKDTARLLIAKAIRGLIYLFRDSLIKRATATPYDPIGTYMERYWLVPYVTNATGGSNTGVGGVSFWRRPIAWLFQRLGIAIRVHCIKESDHDGAYHDHPWNFMSIILDGRYWEHRPTFHQGLFSGNVAERFQTGDVIFRKAGDLHRLELPDDTPVWTLFITGKWLQDWGFVENPGNKVYWRDYLASGKRDASQSIKVAPREDNYNYELGVAMDFIVNGFGATEDHRVVEAAIREAGKFRDIGDDEVAAIMRRIVAPRPVTLKVEVKATDGGTVDEVEGSVMRFINARWLLAACKDCGNLTHASRWDMPKEAALMLKERGKLEAEGRHPYSGLKAKDAPWCECDQDRVIAHLVKP